MIETTAEAPTARGLAAQAERLVQQAEVALAAATDPTGRDIAETELQAAMALQDEVLERVGPVIEREEVELRRQVRAAIASLRNEPGCDFLVTRRGRGAPVLLRRRVRKGSVMDLETLIARMESDATRFHAELC